MSQVQINVMLKIYCQECLQGQVDGKPCPRCGGNMEWQQEMPLERFVLMARDYLIVAEQVERDEKIAKATAERKARKSPIIRLGEV